MLLRLIAVSLLFAAQNPPKPPAPNPPNPPAPSGTPEKGAPGDKAASTTQAPEMKLEKQTRVGADGVTLTADYHALPFGDSDRPLVVSFHMEGGSRGEFTKIAPLFGIWACSSFAVDLRNGKASGDVPNETAASAASVLKKTEFTNEEAYADVVEGLKWAREIHPDGKIIALGSGTSASLVLVAVARDAALADMVFAFSPSEDVPGWSVAMESRKLTVPTFVTCDGSPQEVAKARMIGNSIDKKLRQVVLPIDVKGAKRGAAILLQETPELHDRHWMTIVRMLLQIAPAAAPAAQPGGAEPKKS